MRLAARALCVSVLGWRLAPACPAVRLFLRRPAPHPSSMLMHAGRKAAQTEDRRTLPVSVTCVRCYLCCFSLHTRRRLRPAAAEPAACSLQPAVWCFHMLTLRAPTCSTRVLATLFFLALGDRNKIPGVAAISRSSRERQDLFIFS